MLSEITVIVSDDDKSLRQKHLSYAEYKISSDDNYLKDIIKQATDEFKGEPKDVIIKIKVTV